MALIQAQSEMHSALDQAERSVAATGRALLTGDADQVRSATRDLHDSAHALARVLRGVDSQSALDAHEPSRGAWPSQHRGRSVHDRLVQVARDISMQREALLRRSAVVDRAVQSLLPQLQPSTYTGALGRYAGRALPGSAFRTV